MTQTQYAAPRGDYGAPPRAEADMSLFLGRWLKVWVALITVIILVVIVYLLFITNSLASIDDNLAPTERSVAGAGSDVERLPDQVQTINRSLESIDPSLRPINGQLDEIIAALAPIDAKLKTTSGSLVDTASMLRSVTGQAVDIRCVVAAAQAPGSAGTELIWKQVGGAAGGFGDSAFNVLQGGVRSDAANIITGLQHANAHLATVP